jgi:NAD(P)-dependent dehydrogenase (short-subunit alcohol dehydrogenase family)
MLSAFDSGSAATHRMMEFWHPHIRAQRDGAIVNFASSAETRGSRALGACATVKEAIRGVTKVAAQESEGTTSVFT